MQRFILYSILIVTFYTACKKTDLIADRYSTMYYSILQCDHYPWNNGEPLNDSLTIINLAQYLDSLNLYYADITIKYSPFNQCTACGCPPTEYVCVTTFETLEPEYGKIGFGK